jgi:Ca2+-binding EF-hand superfamily protein
MVCHRFNFRSLVQAKEVSQEEQKDCFSALDTEQKAHLTKTQVKVGVRALGKSPTEAEIDAVVKDMRKLFCPSPKPAQRISVARNSSNFCSAEDISFPSFKGVYQNKFPTPQSQDARAREILRMLDPTNDGLMKESDFRQMLSTIGEPMGHAEVRLTLKTVLTLKVDLVMEDCVSNANGYFRYEDFITMLVTGYMDHIVDSQK